MKDFGEGIEFTDRLASTASTGTSVMEHKALEVVRSVVASGLLLLVLIGFERLVFTKGDFAELSLHPFWLVVVVSAVHGGLVPGVITALLASLVVASPLMASAWDFALWPNLPAQWLGVAFSIGAFRQFEVQRSDKLQSENTRLTAMNETLSAELIKTDDALDAAQMAVASRRFDSEFAFQTLEAILDLEVAPKWDLLTRVREVAARLTPLEIEVLNVSRTGEAESLSGVPWQDRHSQPRSRILETLTRSVRERAAQVLPAQNVNEPECFLVIAAYPEETRKYHAAGALVFICPSQAEAEAVCPVANILSRALEITASRHPAKDPVAPAMTSLVRPAELAVVSHD